MVSAVLESAEDREVAERSLAESHIYPKRIARPEEVARLVCFLASDESEFINGAAYEIDAGQLAWRGME
jgi:NAD(P)-dependent dehydrogenase (short-subunit alcohol dehydrogenase family)